MPAATTTTATTAAATPTHNKSSDKHDATQLFFSVLALCDPFLSTKDQNRIACCSRALATHHRKYLFHPVAPLSLPRQMFHRRAKGFGRSKIGLYTAHDTPGFEIIVHHLWEFLGNDDRANLARADTIFSQYADLRQYAFCQQNHLFHLRDAQNSRTSHLCAQYEPNRQAWHYYHSTSSWVISYDGSAVNTPTAFKT
jgi:hypothetical protein